MRSAPRLISGDCRLPVGHGLPEHIKEGLQAIARAENQSLSWVLEQALIQFFQLPQPAYKTPTKGRLLHIGAKRRRRAA